MKLFKSRVLLLAASAAVLSLSFDAATAAALVLSAPFPNAASAAIGGGGTLDKIRTSGVLTLGIREKALPFSDIEAGVAKGYSVDICNRVAQSVISVLGQPIRLNYVAVNSKTGVNLLKKGVIDIECGTTTHTTIRENEVDFSLPIFISGVRISVRSGSAIHSLDDLGGQTVAVVANSTAESLIKRALISSSGFRREFKIKPVADNDAGVQAVADGSVQAFCTDDVLMAGAIANQGLVKKLIRVGPLISVEPYAFMYRKNDAAFEKLADKAIREVLVSGAALGLVDKWMKTPELQYTLNSLTRENFRFSTKFAAPSY